MKPMHYLVLAILLPLLASCAGTRVPETVKLQRQAREDFERVRQVYFDTGDIAAAREGLAAVLAEQPGQIPDELFDFQARLDALQELAGAADSYAQLPPEEQCASEMARLDGDRIQAAALSATSHGAETRTLLGLHRSLDEAKARLRDCVLRWADDLSAQERLLATSDDPAVLRPLLNDRDAVLSAEGSLETILPYLRMTRGYRHSQALIDKTDRLLAQSQDRDRIAAYLYDYADHPHDDALLAHLDRLYAESGDWTAMEAYLQRFRDRPHAASLESKLLDYYRQEFETGARLWDEEKFAEAVGHLAVVAPRSPQFGPARSLLHEAAELGYYRWDLPEVWITAPPYRW